MITTSRNAIRLVGTNPPARPAISIASASECPDPNAWTTPPSRNDATMRSAATCTGPSACSLTVVMIGPSASR